MHNYAELLTVMADQSGGLKDEKHYSTSQTSKTLTANDTNINEKSWLVAPENHHAVQTCSPVATFSIFTNLYRTHVRVHST